jgi:hypothetical protein
MTASLIITTGLNGFILALTPHGRWDAVRQLDSNVATQRWFTVLMLALVITLSALLLGVSLYRTAREIKAAERMFSENARKRGLSERESEVLLAAAIAAGLKRGAAIFTDSGAFDRGSAQIIENGLKSGQTDEQNKGISAELARLREKLGFRVRPVSSVGEVTRSKTYSSRQIPAGKELYIIRGKAGGGDSADVKCTVTETSDVELKVKLATPVDFAAGEICTVRYDLGAYFWEFETRVSGAVNGGVAFSHSDDVRRIDRRRFARVSVSRAAMAALFPFSKTVAVQNGNGKAGKGGDVTSAALPRFVPAVVTEIAGVGLQMDSKLEANVGDRVVVIFGLNGEQTSDAALAQGQARVIEDIGIVRKTSAGQNGFSISVELTGLSESDVNELVRLTSAASLKPGGEKPATNPEENKEPVTQAATVGGD